MKKTFTFILLIALIITFVSACGNNPASETPSAAPTVSQAQPSSSSNPPEEPQKSSEPEQPEKSVDPDAGLKEAHEDVMGDLETYNTYHDEENALLLSYPNVFSAEGELDQNGYVRFRSHQDDSELLYWVVPNTYGETPADFMERVSAEDMMELEGNAVIGKMDDMDQETGEHSLGVYYWVVDIDWIVNVSIICDTPEYAEIIYADFQNGAVFIESVAGID